MEGLMIFTGLVMITFGILQIILFFKVWAMTNNVKRIWKKINDDSPIGKACFAFIKGDIENVEKLLNDAFLQDISNLSAISDDYDTWISGYKELEEKYTRAFKKIDKPAPDFDKYRDVKMYLL